MFRKKGKIRFGIRFQMAMGILVVFWIGVLAMYWEIHTQIQRSQEEQITQEMQEIRENTRIYVRQLLMMNNANNDEASYRQIAGDIAREMHSMSGRMLNVLDKEGKYLEGSSSFLQEAPKEDLTIALEGSAAFTITYPQEDQMIVWFSMPMEIEGKTVGIVRYQIDESWLFLQGKQTENLVLRTSVVVFGVTLLLLLVLLGRMLQPIQKLTWVSRQVTQDLVREQVDTQMLAGLADSRRRDEVGELSRNFRIMLETLGAQFQKMRDDQERIIQLLGSRQEFYNNVTHELKTPLTTIQGYAQLMEADKGADAKLTDQGLHHILQESTRLHQMVLQLLEMSDRDLYMEKQALNLAEVARSVAGAMSIKAERYGMRIDTELPQELFVLGLPERLRQVLINLVDNAIKYGESHTEIRIQGMRKEGFVLMSVWNHGKGLNAEDKVRVFDPFYRTDKAYSREQGSAGLGLSICRKILREHGGTIGVESEPGEQTMFYFRLQEAEAEHS